MARVVRSLVENFLLFMEFTSKNKNCALRNTLRAQNGNVLTFFHPEFTVGSGITPDRPFGSRTVTAGRESHPALKILCSLVYRIAPVGVLVKKYKVW